MAIYQFTSFLIPKESLIQENGELPSKIEFKLEMDGERTKKFWVNRSPDMKKLTSDIDKILPKASWGEGTTWKMENSEVDHDAYIDFDEELQKIEEIQFRIDLRDSDYEIYHAYLNFAREHDLLIMDIYGNLARPEKKEVTALIKSSDSVRFLSDPISFLDSLG